MLLLDTNVVSALRKVGEKEIVRPWLDRQAIPSVWLTDITIAELRFGVAAKPKEQGREQLSAYYETLIAEFVEDGRVASFTTATTRHYARGMARAQAAGRELKSFAHGAIAAIALERRAMVATRDIGPFEAIGVRIVNPWTET